jgi:hypothetical protein
MTKAISTKSASRNPLTAAPELHAPPPSRHRGASGHETATCGICTKVRRLTTTSAACARCVSKAKKGGVRPSSSSIKHQEKAAKCATKNTVSLKILKDERDMQKKTVSHPPSSRCI